jgi:hypothetical protein
MSLMTKKKWKALLIIDQNDYFEKQNGNLLDPRVKMLERYFEFLENKNRCPYVIHSK